MVLIIWSLMPNCPPSLPINPPVPIFHITPEGRKEGKKEGREKVGRKEERVKKKGRKWVNFI